ncbi:f-box-like domain-containing protein [Trichoderma breve]|uniref:F-box-like domain-containing protein n=1 Tax=Trichoderma breve TaxID=2034170 RepID=A0A9W9BGM3_9HYPO|nr:f-box-like domain-containing protein [Trichoderma breve]KAJ4860010.1 f-box-like domain-containing protein [Trichoderma breve]
MSRLSALPQELTLQIFRLLELGDKVRLSATCRQYRAQLAPEIFKTIRLTNNERIAQSVLGAIETYGEYTTRMEFTAHCGPNDELTTPALTPAAAKVIQGHLTPNLRTFSLKSDFDFDNGEEWDSEHPDAVMGMSIYIFEGVETEEHIREREETWQWRALINETWRALAANIHVRELIVDELIPKRTSAFLTEEFRQFLSRLETASFKIFGTDNGAGWKTNTVWGYVDFLEKMDTTFFHHMTGLKHLAIHAADPLGHQPVRTIQLSLMPDDLPLLESLKLTRCFVGPELVSFIGGHLNVLKSLDVKECVAGGEHPYMEEAYTWASFFDAVYEAKPALTELIAGDGDNVPLTRDEKYSPDYHFEDEPEDIQDIRRKLKADPRLRLFGYGAVDDKYGMFFLDEDTNEEEFKKGDDQRAFDRLMGLVTENAAKSKQ